MNDKEKRIRRLMRLIDEEIDKPDCDMELIDRYNKELDELDGGMWEPSPETKERALKELRKAFEEAESDKKATKEEPVKTKRSFSFPKWKIAVAACICLIILPVGVSAFSSASPVDLISSLGRRIFNMEVNKPYDFGELTFIRNGETITYDNIKECLSEEGIDILYPTWLPDGVLIESVKIFNDGEGDVVLFEFNDDSIMMSIDLYSDDLSVFMNSKAYRVEICNDIECYIETQKICDYNNVEFARGGCRYSISLKDIEIYPMIIENLK